MTTCSACEHWIKSHFHPERGGVCSHLGHRAWAKGSKDLIRIYTQPTATCDDWEAKRPRFGWVEENRKEVER